MNVTAAIVVLTRKIVLKETTVRQLLKTEIRSFLYQERWKKREQNVLNE